MSEISIRIAENKEYETVRQFYHGLIDHLDVLEGNLPAEKLYTGCGFTYLGTLPMFYEDTGWTNYRLYEYVIC